MTPRSASFRRGAAMRATCVAVLALVATATATATATDLSAPDDDCTNVEVFAIFPRHVDDQVVHARFDVRALDPSVVGPGSGRLGHIEGQSHPDHDVRVTTTLCLPRDQAFFLIASGNATRGSAFGRFTVTVASLEYHNMTIFSAGSEWTRGARYDSDDPVGEGDVFHFLEDQGVGPPLWDTPDPSRVYKLHGRARFDTWHRSPVAAVVDPTSMASSPVVDDCEALVAVIVGCTSYGNGARPTDMGWDIHPASGGDAVASARGDRFAWGANVVTTHCLSAGSYEFVAKDFGTTGRGWGAGTTLAVLELTPSDGLYFHGRPLGGSTGSPAWFDRGETAKFTFEVRGSAAAAMGRRPVAEAKVIDPTTIAALGAVRLLPEDTYAAPRAKTIAARRALLSAAPGAKATASAGDSVPLVPVPAAAAAIAAVVAAVVAANARSRRRDTVERVSLLHSEADGAYGADVAVDVSTTTPSRTPSASKKSFDGSPSRVVVAAAAAAFGAVATFGVARHTVSNASALGAALGQSSDAPRGLCGAGVRACSLLESPDCATRTYAYRRGMLAHLQGGTGAARVLTPYGAHVVSFSPSTIDDVPGECGRREFVEGGDFDWSEPGTSATARKGAKLGGGTSGCRADIDGFEGVTVDECREACATAPGCESYHAFHVAGADGAFADDDLSCRLCGRGGEGAFVPPAGDVETFRGPAWCITEHNFTLVARSPVECAAACDATDGCDAFNYGDNGGDCLLLALGPDAKDGMLWRGSGLSPTGVMGHATYYVTDAVEIAAASEEVLPAEARDGRCATNPVVAPGENLAVGGVPRPAEAAAAFDGQHHGDAYATDGSCPAVARGLSDVGVADASLEVDLRGAFTLGDVVVEAAPARAASLGLAPPHRGKLGAPERAKAIVEALDQRTGEWVECGFVGPFDPADAGAPKSFAVSGCAETVASEVRVRAQKLADAVLVCEVEAIAKGGVERRPPATPLWLTISDEDEGATDETMTMATTTDGPGPAPETTPEVVRMDDSDFVAKAHPTPAPTPVPTPTTADIIADVNEATATATATPAAANPTATATATPAAAATPATRAQTRAQTPSPTPTQTPSPTPPSADDDVYAAEDIFSVSPTSMSTPPPTRDPPATPEDSFTSSDAFFAADPSVMPTPGADDAHADDAATPKPSPKPSPRPSPSPSPRPSPRPSPHPQSPHPQSPAHPAPGEEFSPRPTPRSASVASPAATPRASPTPVATPSVDSGGVSEDVSASTDIEDGLNEPVAADEDTGPRPASRSDATTNLIVDTVEDAIEDVEDAVEDTFDFDESSDAAAGPETAPNEVVIPDGATSFPPPPPPVGNAPPPAPVVIPEIEPTLPSCTNCARPPCHAFVPDVARRDFVADASSCCQALKWTYGNTVDFPHVCGRCHGEATKMTFRDAERFCVSRGAGLCAEHQVAAAGRTPGCAVSRDAPAWTATACGEDDAGRVATRAGGGGEKTCVENLDMTAEVLCCANTCNTFTPNHMCPSPVGGQQFWQATAQMGMRERRTPDGRARDANRRVALPTMPRGDVVRAAKLGAAESEEAKVTRATRDAGVPSLRKEAVLTAAHQALGEADEEALAAKGQR